MKLVILSNYDQYKKLVEYCPNIEDIQVVCDSLSFQHFLKKKKINFLLLEEGILKEDWNKINIWGCDKALNWGDFLKEQLLFQDIELNNAIYVFFSCFLIEFLKNYLYVRYICEKYNPKELIVFEGYNSKSFPVSNGNIILNTILLKMKDKYEYDLHVLEIKNKKNRDEQQSIKNRIRKQLQKYYSSFQNIEWSREAFLACGSLRHLGLVLEEIKKRDCHVFVYDFEFHLEQYKFCRKNKFNYILPDYFLSQAPKDSGFAEYQEDFMKLLDTFEHESWFEYYGENLSVMICEAIRDSYENYISTITSDTAIYKQILNILKIKALIVDEDWGVKRGFMTAFFKSRGIKTFCISHGYGAQRFSVDIEKRNFSLSETLVNSKFERSLYGARGWDEKHIHVTGIPKHDNLVEKIKKGKKKGNRPVFFFCGTSLHEYELSQASYIGLTQFERGIYMKEHLRQVIKAISEYDVKLMVRPHPSDIARYMDEKRLWKEEINRADKGKSDIVFCDEKYDFYDILSNCDAMVIGYWTPAIVEALISDVPTLVLNFSELKDGFPFAEEGLCEVTRDITGLRDFVKRICDNYPDNMVFGNRNISPEQKYFYLGRKDTKNTLRAVDKIFEIMS